MSKRRSKAQSDHLRERQLRREAELREAEMTIMELRRTISEGSIWRHIRSGIDYKVLFLAINENSLNAAVVYEKARGAAHIWTRPAQQFTDGRFKELT